MGSSIFPIIIFVVFAIIANAISGSKKTNVKRNSAPVQKEVDEKQYIPRQVGKSAEPIEVPIFMQAEHAASKKAARAAKPTIEKTHSHKGEVSGTVLLEDREHDWLAQQIREEAKIARQRMQ